MGELSGKTALITGGGRGIGKGIALVLAEKGADIIVNDLAETSDVTETLELLKTFGNSVYFKAGDVSSEKDVIDLFAYARSIVKTLDILINNAGTSQSKDIFDITLDDWDFIIRTNLTSCFLCSKYGMNLMKEQQGGKIINISSVVGQQGALYGHAHYAASKSALLGLTKTLARTGAPLGIRVNAIAPGIIATDLLLKTHGEPGIEKLAAGIPLGIGNTRDIGLAAAFLAGEGGNYITGTTLDVNGGYYLR